MAIESSTGAEQGDPTDAGTSSAPRRISQASAGLSFVRRRLPLMPRPPVVLVGLPSAPTAASPRSPDR